MIPKDSTRSISLSRMNSHPKLRLLVAGARRLFRYQSPVSTTYDEYPDPAGLSYSNESITYDVGAAFFKNVVHTSTVRSLEKADPGYWINQTFPATVSPNYSTIMIPAWYYALSINGVQGHPSNPTFNSVTIQLSDLEGALSRAHRNMLPRVEDITGGVNIVNFVLELKDIKMMFSLWKKSYGVLRNLSAGVLNYSYAWRPFISDLIKIHKGITQLDSYVTRWNKDAKAGTIWSRHADITADVWKNDQSYATSITDSSWGTFCNNHTYKNTNIRNYVEDVVVKAHLSFKPNHIDLAGINKLAMYFDMAGLGDPLSIVWEAIPFSFLVDYFLSVSKFVSQFDHDFFLTPITVVNFGYSVKTSQKYDFQRNSQVKRTSNGAITSFIGPRAIYECKVYTRMRLGLPPLPQGGNPVDVDLGLLEFHWPSLRQAFLMVNLFNVLRR